MTKEPARAKPGNSQLSLGIDIGSTKALGVVLDADQAVVAEAAMFSRRGEKGVKAVLMELARALAAKAGVGLRDFDSVGVGIPGVVDRKTGEITSAVNLRIEHLALGKAIARHFSVPVRLDNDVKATVVGAGMLLDSLSVTYVNFGTGLAAATLAGRLIRGRDNLAGEIGHLVVHREGTPCRCGQRGCLETVVGGSYLAPMMARLGLDWTKLDRTDSPVGQEFHTEVVDVVARIITLVGVAYGSDHIVLGGGVVQAAPWLLPEVRRLLIERGGVATFPPYVRLAEQTVFLKEDIRLPAIGCALIGQGWTEGYKR